MGLLYHGRREDDPDYTAKELPLTFDVVKKALQAQTKLNDMLLNLLHAKCNLTDDETRELSALIRDVKNALE